jgi:hypothetical protein
MQFSDKVSAILRDLSYVTQFGTIGTTRSIYKTFRVSLSRGENRALTASSIFRIKTL